MRTNARATEFAALVAKADAAGRAAADTVAVRPMVVSEASTGQRWYVADGVCGFAWVTVRPGNSPFANYLKKAGLAQKAYGGGVQIWVGAYNQSMTRKEAYARAYADVLTAAGITAYAGSRMD